MLNKSILTVLAVILFSIARAQNPFYDISSIQKVEIQFSQPNWDYMMDTSKYGSDGYIMADWVKVNGVQIDSVGVKYKGNSSYDSTYIKNPVHIEIDNLLNQSYQGVTDIKLSNSYADPSMIREVLAYDILRNYMHCPGSNFAQLYINGNYIGLYSNDENINKDFCSNHFYSSQNTFLKCNPIVLPGPTTKSNLKYINSDSSSYFNFYELKSTEGWNDLVALCDSATNHGSTISNTIDLDRLIWMLAFNSLLVNLDSYTGVFCQNYYLYKDNTGHYNPVVWDLNMAFGGFPYVGSGNSSMGSLTISNMQQLNPTIHASDPYWPLINAVMNNSSAKKMYFAHMKTIAEEMFASNLYISKSAQLQALVDTAVQSDPYKFYSYTQFQNAMTTDYSVGSYSVPGISNLMSARLTYLQGFADYAASQPVISAVQPSNASPTLNATVTITALVTNTDPASVYLGYRDDIALKFTRTLMYDDGLHNDGASGDNVYGADLFISSATVQYYIYAENSGAAKFAPERAEHEYYSVSANIQQLSAGDVVINEVMAVNQNTVTDVNGEYEDWIEFRNNLSAPVSLTGCYLSDDPANLQKWAFPSSTVIPANGYLIVWADEDFSQTGLHSDFKLAASGEQVLFGYAATLLDSVSFSQQTADVSIGRCTALPFVSMVPSFNAANNCPVGVGEYANNSGVSVFPNPSHGKVNVVSMNVQPSVIRVFDLTSKLKDVILPNESQTLIDLTSYPSSVYFIQVDDHLPVKIVLINN